MSNTLFIGNSHLVSLIDAALRRAGGLGQEMDIHAAYRDTVFRRHDIDLPASPRGQAASRLRFILAGARAPSLFLVNGEGRIALSSAFVEELRSAAASFGSSVDRVVSYFHGNEHSSFSIVEHQTPFDVFLDASDRPSDPAGPPRQVLPLAVVRRELAARAKPTILYCQTLKSLFPAQEVLHLLPPPPIESEAQLRSHPEVFGELFEAYGVAPAALRRKVYTLYGEVLREALQPLGVRVAGVPDGAHLDGYLHEDWAVASTHATHRYGELVLQDLGAF